MRRRCRGVCAIDVQQAREGRPYETTRCGPFNLFTQCLVLHSACSLHFPLTAYAFGAFFQLVTVPSDMGLWKLCVPVHSTTTR